MKLHLICLNALALVSLPLLAPVAVHHNLLFTLERVEELSQAGVIDDDRLATFAQSIGESEIAANRRFFVNWLKDSSATNYLLVLPAFFIYFANTALLLRIYLREISTERQSPPPQSV